MKQLKYKETTQESFTVQRLFPKKYYIKEFFCQAHFQPLDKNMMVENMCQNVWLYLWPINETMHELLLSNGFRFDGERTNILNITYMFTTYFEMFMYQPKGLELLAKNIIISFLNPTCLLDVCPLACS